MQPSVLAPPLATRRQLGWLFRNRRRVITVSYLGLFIAGTLFVAARFESARTQYESSGVYAATMAAVSHDPVVLSELGSPIELGWFVSSSIQISDASGYAALSIPISGPWRSGNVQAVATRVAGEWTFSTLSVTVEDNSTPIDLVRSQ
jgi:hypothetical protein